MNKAKILKKMMIVAVAMIIGCSTMLLYSNNAQAASWKRSSVEDALITFWVPEGGISSIQYTVRYVENYTTSGSNSTFSSRRRTCFGKTPYATSNPTLSLLNVSHRNASGTTLATMSSWTSVAGIFPGDVTFCGSSENTTSRTYPKSTSNVGTLYYSIYCSGAVAPTRTGSLDISLNTN